MTLFGSVEVETKPTKVVLETDFCGVGAKISVYKKFLHPRATVCSRYPNASKNDVLDDLLVIGHE
jgi:hypothetical protein